MASLKGTGYTNPAVGEQGLIVIKADVDRESLIGQKQRDGFFRRATDGKTLRVLGNELAVSLVTSRTVGPKPRVITKLNGFGTAGSAVGLEYARNVLQFAGITMSDTQDGPDLEGVSPTNGVGLKVRGALSLYTPYVFKAGQAIQWHVATREEYDHFANEGLFENFGVVSEAIMPLARPYTPRSTVTEFLDVVRQRFALRVQAAGGAAAAGAGLLFDPSSLETKFFEDSTVLHEQFMKAIYAIGVTFMRAALLATSATTATANDDALVIAQRLGLIAGSATGPDLVAPIQTALLAGLFETQAASTPAVPVFPGDSTGAQQMRALEANAVQDFMVAYDTAVSRAHSRIFATCTAGADEGQRIQGYM